MLESIAKRSSIRKYSEKEIPREVISEIIESGVKAPSAKNRQPWKFIVVQGNAKEEMLRAFADGLTREEKGSALLPNSRQHLAGARHTLTIMAQAPAVVFVLNTLSKGMFEPMTNEEIVYECANIQSVSAAIQNMLLTATSLGLGSLWICDVFFAYPELKAWLAEEGEMVAAVALGYPAGQVWSRPRKAPESVTEWRM